jgi:acyl-CoA thioesterase I
MRILTTLALALFMISGATGCERRQEELRSRPGVIEEFSGIIVAMGDSLTAGLGVEEAQAYPSLLAGRLATKGLNYRVINAGISGETSSGALERTNWILSFKPDIVILETGANDGLRGLDPGLIENNLDKIVATLKQHDVTVVLCGMRMVRNLGAEYTDAFAALYPKVARRHEVIFMPFFLAGVAGESKLNQPDGIHPTAAGYQKIVDNLLPYVLEAIDQRNSPVDSQPRKE